MSSGISYSRELVEAAKQYARNWRQLTREQYGILARFEPGRNYYKASAEILLNLLEGADVHDKQPVKPKTCGECAKEYWECTTSPGRTAPSECFQPREEGGKK